MSCRLIDFQAVIVVALVFIDLISRTRFIEFIRVKASSYELVLLSTQQQSRLTSISFMRLHLRMCHLTSVRQFFRVQVQL